MGCASTPRSISTSASSHPSEVAGPAALRGRTPRRVMTLVPTPTSKVSFEQFGNKGSSSEQDNVLPIYFLKVQGGFNWSALKNNNTLYNTYKYSCQKLLWVWHLDGLVEKEPSLYN